MGQPIAKVGYAIKEITARPTEAAVLGPLILRNSDPSFSIRICPGWVAVIANDSIHGESGTSRAAGT